MGKAVWEAAKDGKEAELRRLIDLGGNVNWHHPEVRRRMCLAWSPASSPPLMVLRSHRHRRRARPRRRLTPQLAARRARARAAALAVPPTRRPAELGTRVLVAWRAPHPRVLVHAPRVLALDDSVVLGVPRSTDTQL